MFELLPADIAERLGAQLHALLGNDRLLEMLKPWQNLLRQKGTQAPEGMHEILEYESLLELRDRKGENAVLERREKVRFLQDNVIAFEDQVWGEGNALAGYECSPGIAVDRYRDGPRWKVLISLRESKRRGDITEFRFRRVIAGGFTEADEWLQTELGHKTDHLLLRIVFPRSRPCQGAVLVERYASRISDIPPSCFGRLPDGRQVLTWQTDRPDEKEIYTIHWRW